MKNIDTVVAVSWQIKSKNCSSCREEKTLKLMLCFPPIHPFAISDGGFGDSSKNRYSRILNRRILVPNKRIGGHFLEFCFRYLICKLNVYLEL